MARQYNFGVRKLHRADKKRGEDIKSLSLFLLIVCNDYMLFPQRKLKNIKKHLEKQIA